MKGLRLIILTFLSILFLMPVAFAQSRGAENTKELSDRLFQAIRMNNFESLTNYIPNEDQMESLQEQAHEANKPVFDATSAEMVEAAVLHGFDEIIRTGIQKNINWSNTELVDYATRTCSIVIIGCNVSFTIQDMSENRIRVTYDALKIGDRWFLFQNLQTLETKK